MHNQLNYCSEQTDVISTNYSTSQNGNYKAHFSSDSVKKRDIQKSMLKPTVKEIIEYNFQGLSFPRQHTHTHPTITTTTIFHIKKPSTSHVFEMLTVIWEEYQSFWERLCSFLNCLKNLHFIRGDSWQKQCVCIYQKQWQFYQTISLPTLLNELGLQSQTEWHRFLVQPPLETLLWSYNDPS